MLPGASAFYTGSALTWHQAMPTKGRMLIASFPRGTGIIKGNEEGVSHGDPSLRVVSLVLGPGCLEKGGEITVI